MNIILNGQQIDFSLNEEKTLKDLTGSIINFLNDNRHILKEMKVDGTILSIQEAFESVQAIDDITHLEIVSESIIKEVSEIIPTLNMSIEMLLTQINEQNFDNKEKNDFIDHLSWIMEGVESISQALKVPLKYVLSGVYDTESLISEARLFKDQLKARIHDTPFFLETLTYKIKPKLSLLVEQMIPSIIDFYNFFFVEISNKTQFHELFERIIISIQKTQQELFSVVALLQEGKMKEATYYIHQSVVVYEFLIMIYKRLLQLDYHSYEESIEDIKIKLDSHIKDMIEALEQNDVVSICDLLEYEFFNDLNELLRFIKESL